MNTVKKSLYPWDDWLTRKRFTISQGVHFHCAMHGMVQQIRNAFRANGKSVHIHVDDALRTITVEAAQAKTEKGGRR